MKKTGERIWEYFEPYQRAIAVILNAALVLLAFWLTNAALVKKDWLEVVISSTLLILVAFLDDHVRKVYIEGRTRKIKETAIKELKENYIKELLEAAAISVKRAARPPIDHIRVNIMFPDEEKRFLVIRYEHNFAPEDKDRHIKIRIGTGVSGQAWHHCEAMVADVTQLSRVDKPDEINKPEEALTQTNWGLHRDEIVKIRRKLKSIYCIPIMGQDAPIATLSFDSDNTIEEMGFNDEGIQKIMYSFATILEGLLEDIS